VSDPEAARLLAVVPAYNEEGTVAGVLDRLYRLVDELIVVDDGSTDGTRWVVQEWLSGREKARLLTFDVNRGMSAAYYLAFGELGPETLVCTVDADGQHELGALEELVRIASEERADAVIARRDLSGYPVIKRLGNRVMSWWATMWAGSPLPDVESGFRVFRVGALTHSLRFYRGYRYSETVEVAVVLCRLGYTVRNDVLAPVPVVRSRTRLRDAVIDAVMIVVAAWRVRRRREIGVPVGRAVPAAVSTLLVNVAEFARRPRTGRVSTGRCSLARRAGGPGSPSAGRGAGDRRG
jgi:glycosyltransferase involved in cell wall biosynthesis